MTKQEKWFFCLVALAIFLIQPLKFGFDLGGHLGWVASHVSGIITKATAENGFVGYTLQHLDTETMQASFKYFDRYPVYFAALFRVLLSPFEDNLGTWVFVGRQLMHLIFFLTIFYSYRILGHFNYFSQNQKMAVVLLSFSGHYYLEYKAMIHFDQPALLGMVALADAILLYRHRGQRRPLMAWIFIGPLMGRAYASFFLLAGWLCTELFLSFRKRKLKAFIFSLPVALTLASGLVSSSHLFYNVYQEAQVREVPMSEVGIVKSAQRRLGLSYDNEKVKKKHEVGWPKFINGQLARSVKYMTPEVINYLRPTRALFFVALVIFFFYGLKSFWRQNSSLQRASWVVLVLSGPLWTFTMKQLTYFHDYTMIYYFGTSLFVFSVVIYKLQSFQKILPLACIIFLGSIGVRFYTDARDLDKTNQISREFDQVREKLGKDKLIWIPEGYREILERRPYSMGFYLFEHVLTKGREGADFILSKNPREGDDEIFDGEFLHLYKN